MLTALRHNNLRLSTPKTVVCPKSAIILGWIWCNGTLQASPHKIATLCVVELLVTVQGLRSFVGAYKVLSHVLQGYADLLDPLNQAAAGSAPKEKILWSDEFASAFKRAQ